MNIKAQRSPEGRNRRNEEMNPTLSIQVQTIHDFQWKHWCSAGIALSDQTLINEYYRIARDIYNKNPTWAVRVVVTKEEVLLEL